MGRIPLVTIGTCVLTVKYNNVQRDVLFFITDVDDDKVILGAKACQQFKLVEILCDEQCQCKLMQREIATENGEFPAWD